MQRYACHASHISRVRPDITKYVHIGIDMAPLVKLNMMISMHDDIKGKILLTRRVTVAMVHVSVKRGVPDPLMLAKYTTSAPLHHCKDLLRTSMRPDTTQNA